MRFKQSLNSLALLVVMIMMTGGCSRFHVIKADGTQMAGVDLWPVYRNLSAEDAREVQLAWPLFKYQSSGEERLLRLWPLYYGHSGERLFGVARYHEPGIQPAGSDIFSLQENSWEGGLSSLALVSRLSDRYSTSYALAHPSVLMLHLERNREHWPNGRNSQPSGLYSLWFPWWYVEHMTAGTNHDAEDDPGILTHYLPPLIGYDGYRGEFKLLNLYFSRWQMDMMPPVAGVGFGEGSRTYLWPLFAHVHVDGRSHTDLLTRAFSHRGYWTPAWIWDSHEKEAVAKMLREQ